MSLAADDEDGNGLQLQKFGISGRGLFSLCKLRLHLPVDVQR